MNYLALTTMITLLLCADLGARALNYKEMRILPSVARLLASSEALSWSIPGYNWVRRHVHPNLKDVPSALAYFSQFDKDHFAKNEDLPRMHLLSVALRKVFGKNENNLNLLREKYDVVAAGSIFKELIEEYRKMLAVKKRPPKSMMPEDGALKFLLEALLCPERPLALALGGNILRDAYAEFGQIVLTEDMGIDEAHRLVEKYAATMGNVLLVSLEEMIFYKLEKIIKTNGDADSFDSGRGKIELAGAEFRKKLKSINYRYDCDSLFP